MQEQATVVAGTMRKARLHRDHQDYGEELNLDDSHHHSEFEGEMEGDDAGVVVAVDKSDSDETPTHHHRPGTVAATKQAARQVEQKQIEKLARRETNNLRAWRMLLLLFMLSTGAMVAAGTYEYVNQQLQAEDKQSFELFTETIREASNEHCRDLIMAMASLAQTIAVAGRTGTNGGTNTSAIGSSSTNHAFPFVTLPTFEIPAHYALQFSGVEVVTWNPIVRNDQRDAWTDYVKANLDLYYTQSKALHHVQDNEWHEASEAEETDSQSSTSSPRDFIWTGDRNLDGVIETAPNNELLAPIFHCSPPPYARQFFNYDILSEPRVKSLLPALEQTVSSEAMATGFLTAVDDSFATLPTTLVHYEGDFQESYHGKYTVNSENGAATHPHAAMIQPVFPDNNANGGAMIGLLVSNLAFDSFVAHLLPRGVTGITAVLKNTCGQAYSYTLDGQMSKFLGVGDWHEEKHNDTERIVPLFAQNSSNHTAEAVAAATASGHCLYSLHLFYSDSFASAEKSHFATIATAAIATIFGLMAIAFFLYDYMVHKRNKKIVCVAATSNAFLSTLFPTDVRNRLLDAEAAEAADNDDDKKGRGAAAPQLQRMMEAGRFPMEDDTDAQPTFKSKPIADLFNETTVLFADICGFSAWSSVREPSQVFLLLETLFHAFDEIAKKRKVFKVETVGDCYVAVAGLPEIRKDHALVMARFARECMLKMRTLVRKLEVNFGPDTGDLALRIGMHSGPVTAGVLRGERSRFQLFGETMNTAARMEQNGLRDKIHVSQETADLLIAAGKMKWLTRREEAVYSHEKGGVQTYWLEITPARTSETSSQRDSIDTDELRDSAGPVSASFASSKCDSKTIRLIQWNEDVLLRLLKQIVARRTAYPLSASEAIKPNEGRFMGVRDSLNANDDVKEIISLPRFKASKVKVADPDTVELDQEVVNQLRQYLTAVAEMYRNHEFHNFEHASHVAMSVVKLLSRIVDPCEASSGTTEASAQHDRTFGISSDPLTQFSCVLAALVHDVDHPGVPNEQLVREQNELATTFHSSQAERHSLSTAWNMLFEKKYTMLRNTTYETDAELLRFRQVLVNSVLATDLFDLELREDRKLRWDRAFAATASRLTSSEMLNRRATIVVDCLLQASDIAHTMQHWFIYRKWNERLFFECYDAYLEGRADHRKNPADDWYEGELRFYDFNVIPLAHKLKECGVFGVAAEEYLSYAIRNRSDWEKRGRELVREMVDRVNQKDGRLEA